MYKNILKSLLILTALVFFPTMARAADDVICPATGVQPTEILVYYHGLYTNGNHTTSYADFKKQIDTIRATRPGIIGVHVNGGVNDGKNWSQNPNETNAQKSIDNAKKVCNTTANLPISIAGHSAGGDPTIKNSGLATNRIILLDGLYWSPTPLFSLCSKISVIGGPGNDTKANTATLISKCRGESGFEFIANADGKTSTHGGTINFLAKFYLGSALANTTQNNNSNNTNNTGGGGGGAVGSLPTIKNPFDDLQVTIPGMARFSDALVTSDNNGNINITINWIGEYIIGIYNYAIAIIGILAVLAIAIGGVMWIISFGNPSVVSEGKAWITGAILGLVLALGSFILLNTINADLVRMRPIQLGYVEGDEVNPYTTEAYYNGNTIAAQDQNCFLNTFGNSRDVVAARLVTVNCPALGGNIRVHQLAEAAFRTVCSRIPLGLTTTCGTPLRAATGGWRQNTNNTGFLSLHSFGIAVDINGFQCGGCDNRRRNSDGSCPCAVIFPMVVADAFRGVPGFRWGGDYRTRCDNMHFEWLGPCQR